MDQVESFVGIDVSKDRLDVHIRPQGEAFAVARNSKGLDELVEKLKVISPALVVLEATGGFEITVAAAVAGALLPAAVVNPRQIRDFARAMGRLAKTDALDAEVIALFAERIQPEPRPLPDAEARALADLVARRRQILEMITAETNRQRQIATNKRVAKRIAAHLLWLQKELTSVDDDLDDAIRKSPVWREKEDLLTAIQGIGTTTARVLLAEMPELGSLSSKKAAALAGLAPINRDSGLYRGQRTIGGGRKSLRTALYMPTLVAIRHNPVIAAFHQRLIAKGKKPKVAITACMRKLLIIMNAILRDRTKWQNA